MKNILLGVVTFMLMQSVHTRRLTFSTQMCEKDEAFPRSSCKVSSLCVAYFVGEEVPQSHSAGCSRRLLNAIN